MPDIPRILYITGDLIESASSLGTRFTEVRVLQNSTHVHRPRLAAMLECDFEHALFIDGDTLFLDSVFELFDLLEHFDLGIAPAPQHFHPLATSKGTYEALPLVSAAIPEWNSGVIVAKVDAPFRDMVSHWSELLTQSEELGYIMDQPALRSALATSKLRIAQLPVNYNFRVMVQQSVRRKVKIIHGRGKLARIAQRLNRFRKQRVYEPDSAELGRTKPAH